MTFEEKLEKAGKEYDIYFNQQQKYLFKVYYKLLTEYNNKVNLTAITDEDKVILKHFIDSILGLKFIDGKKVIDLGSGAGFPGIPLAIMDNIDLTLVDSIKKKTDFLEMVVSQLGLKNVRVLNSRIEDLAKVDGYRENYDICVSRAVAPLNTLCEYCLPFCKIGGKMLAYKSSKTDQEVEIAKNAIKKTGGNISNIYNLKTSNNRYIVEIKKISATPNIYPREKNNPRKNPL